MANKRVKGKGIKCCMSVFIALLICISGWNGSALAGSNPNTWTDITYNGEFTHPTYVAVDSSGDVYVTDCGNNAIKELVHGDTFWTDITLGGGFNGPCGVAVDRSGDVYVADSGPTAPSGLQPIGQNPDYMIKELAQGASSWTDITNNGGFISPRGVAVDSSGDVYVADCGNNAIKELIKGTSTWGDITYNGGFNGPRGVAVDGWSDVWVADYGNNTIKELNNGFSAWGTNTYNGGFNRPTGVAVDGSGDVYVTDYGNNTIKEYLQGTTSWTDITGDGGFTHPTGVAVDSSGNVYVVDEGNNKIKELFAQTLPTIPLLLNPGLKNNINNVLNNLGKQPQVETTQQGVQVYVNGALVPLDVAPMLVDGRYMVQMRPIFEALGADPPKWDKATKTITDTMGSTTIKLKIGSTTAYKNDVEYTLASPPMLYSTGYTLVPARFVSWAFGYNIKFDPTDNQIDITSNS